MKTAKDLLNEFDNIIYYNDIDESLISKRVQNILLVLNKFFDIKGDNKLSKPDQIMLVKQLASVLKA